MIIPYVSAYGYTAQLAQKIAEGIQASGDVDVRCYDMVEADQAKVLEELGFADGILLGTPTIVGEALKPIWDLTTSIFAGTHGGKLASAFGSYGWSGEGVPHLIERLKQLRMRVVDGFRVRFKPGEENLIDAFDYGYNFGCILQNKENKKSEKTGARQLVKCLVCGEIFDSSLEICPVCGVGKENFVPVDAQESDFSNDTKDFYVILGNGTAGWNAATEIRKCPVCGVGKENFVPVDAQESDFSNDTKDFYVILGNGTAGWNAATEIRKRNKTASILMNRNPKEKQNSIDFDDFK